MQNETRETETGRLSIYHPPLATEDGGGYLIEFPDVPGCISDGEAPEEAIANGRDALKSALLTMKEFGDPVPKPGKSAASSGQ